MKDNNLLLIILIGIVLFWIYNINTKTSPKEKFNNSSNSTNSSRSSNSRQLTQENYRDDGISNKSRSRESSPNLSQQPASDKQLIDRLYSNKRDSKSRSEFDMDGQRAVYENDIKKNPGQKIFDTPPSSLDDSKTLKNYQDIAKQYVPDSKQSTDKSKVAGTAKKDGNYFNVNDDAYMLISKSSVPDTKFKNVMPKDKREVLTSGQLLPKEMNKDWFQVPNAEFNLLQAVDLEIPEIKIGVDTVGQSRKNATYDLRTAPPNPKFVVSPWQNSTIEPDYNTKPLC